LVQLKKIAPKTDEEAYLFYKYLIKSANSTDIISKQRYLDYPEYSPFFDNISKNCYQYHLDLENQTADQIELTENLIGRALTDQEKQAIKKDISESPSDRLQQTSKPDVSQKINPIEGNEPVQRKNIQIPSEDIEPPFSIPQAPANNYLETEQLNKTKQKLQPKDVIDYNGLDVTEDTTPVLNPKDTSISPIFPTSPYSTPIQHSIKAVAHKPPMPRTPIKNDDNTIEYQSEDDEIQFNASAISNRPINYSGKDIISRRTRIIAKHVTP
jgi:hypothetical protein